MVTDEIKSIFRKAKRQVDKPKIWQSKETEKDRQQWGREGWRQGLNERDAEDGVWVCVPLWSVQLTETSLIGLTVMCLICLCPAQQKQQRTNEMRAEEQVIRESVLPPAVGCGRRPFLLATEWLRAHHSGFLHSRWAFAGMWRGIFFSPVVLFSSIVSSQTEKRW